MCVCVCVDAFRYFSVFIYLDIHIYIYVFICLFVFIFFQIPLVLNASSPHLGSGGAVQLGGATPANAAVGTQLSGVPSQETLEALYKQIAANSAGGVGGVGASGGSNSDQLEALQKLYLEKQMLTLIEQQKLTTSIAIPGLIGTTPNLATLSQANPSANITTGTTSTSPAPSVSPGGAEMFQLPPLLLLNMPNQNIASFTPLTPSSTSPAGISSATPSPTTSTTSNAGLSAANLTQLGVATLPLQPSGLSVAARDLLPLATGGAGIGGGGLIGGSATGGVQQRRPLSESLSAPGYSAQDQSQPLDVLQKQYQLQHQQLLTQSQQIHQHYLDQQQRSGWALFGQWS